jgi:lipopolysaccharide export LptBFGC system permease protein LptF
MTVRVILAIRSSLDYELAAYRRLFDLSPVALMAAAAVAFGLGLSYRVRLVAVGVPRPRYPACASA